MTPNTPPTGLSDIVGNTMYFADGQELTIPDGWTWHPITIDGESLMCWRFILIYDSVILSVTTIQNYSRQIIEDFFRVTQQRIDVLAAERFQYVTEAQEF